MIETKRAEVKEDDLKRICQELMKIGRKERKEAEE